MNPADDTPYLMTDDPPTAQDATHRPDQISLEAKNMMTPQQRVTPALRITNYERSQTYYVDTLGFTVEWEHRFEPDFPVFMSIIRDGMRIFLTPHRGDCEVGGLVHFLIPDVDAWYAEFCDKGAIVAEAPNNDLGFRNMTIKDPDGNRLRFMEPAR